MGCRYPNCPTEKLHRFGLCNRHRKWVEKGIIDVDLNLLKPLPSKVSYKNQVCKVEDCGLKPRRNFFCEKHSRQYREGILSKHGTRIKPLVRYSKDFRCIKCGASGKITKGFCKSHYSQLRAGLIDFDGSPKRDRKRREYSELDFCKITGCGLRPKERGFCRNHAEAVRRGSYDENGARLTPELSKNSGKRCLECNKPAVTRLLCPLHYYRKYQASRRVLINKGKTCSAFSCNKPAHCRGLCLTHYGRRKSRMKYEQRVKAELQSP